MRTDVKNKTMKRVKLSRSRPRSCTRCFARGTGFPSKCLLCREMGPKVTASLTRADSSGRCSQLNRGRPRRLFSERRLYRAPESRRTDPGLQLWCRLPGTQGCDGSECFQRTRQLANGAAVIVYSHGDLAGAVSMASGGRLSSA